MNVLWHVAEPVNSLLDVGCNAGMGLGLPIVTNLGRLSDTVFLKQMPFVWQPTTPRNKWCHLRKNFLTIHANSNDSVMPRLVFMTDIALSIPL